MRLAARFAQRLCPAALLKLGGLVSFMLLPALMLVLKATAARRAAHMPLAHTLKTLATTRTDCSA
jgi:hypothetical protein